MFFTSHSMATSSYRLHWFTISSMRIQYLLEDDTRSSCIKWLMLVRGMASIMFPATSTFSWMCAVRLAPTLPRMSSRTLSVCSNLDTRCWMTLFAGHLCLWTLNNWSYDSNFGSYENMFLRKTHTFTEYSMMTGVKSNTWKVPSSCVDKTVLPLMELPTILVLCYLSSCHECFFWKRL